MPDQPRWRLFVAAQENSRASPHMRFQGAFVKFDGTGGARARTAEGLPLVPQYDKCAPLYIRDPALTGSLQASEHCAQCNSFFTS